MRRPESLSRGPRVLGRRVLAAACLWAACAAPEGPTVEVPTDATAVEVRFGDAFCRRIEDPQAVSALVEFAAGHRDGWQAAWNEQEPPRLVFRFSGGAGAELALGVGEGQLHTPIAGRDHFQPLSESARRDLLARLGGPPAGPPEIPCRGAPTPPAP